MNGASRESVYALLQRWEKRLHRKLIGWQAGLHPSPERGRGLDYLDVRPYSPGDDWRRIDAKVSARTGTLHVRRFADEQQRTVWIAVESSAAMHWGSRGESPLATKWQRAVEVAALFSLAFLQHGDRVGIATAADSGGPVAMPQQGLRSLPHLLHAWQRLTPPQPVATTSDLEETLQRLNRQRKRAQIVLFVDETGPILRDLLAGTSRRHSVSLIPVSDPLERELPRERGLLRFQDVRTGRHQVVDASDPVNRQRYAQAATERRLRWQSELRPLGINWWDWRKLEALAK